MPGVFVLYSFFLICIAAYSFISRKLRVSRVMLSSVETFEFVDWETADDDGTVESVDVISLFCYFIFNFCSCFIRCHSFAFI